MIVKCKIKSRCLLWVSHLGIVNGVKYILAESVKFVNVRSFSDTWEIFHTWPDDNRREKKVFADRLIQFAELKVNGGKREMKRNYQSHLQSIADVVQTLVMLAHNHHHHHHQFLNRQGRWGTTNDFATSFLHFPLFSTSLWDLPNSRSAHSLMLSSHLFLCLPCLLPPFTVPCKMVLARRDERETWPYHCNRTRGSRKHGAWRPQKPLRLIRYGEVGGSGIFFNLTSTRYTVTTRMILR